MKKINTIKPIKTTRRKTRILTLTLAATLAVSLAGSVSWADASRYIDVKNTHWAWPAIQSMSQKGIIQGYPDGSFRPGEEVTYGEFIKMAVMATASATANEGASGDNVEDGFAGNGNPKEKLSEGNAVKGNWDEGYYQKALENSLFTANNIAAHQLPREIPRSDMALIISSTLGDAPIHKYSEILDNLQDVEFTTKGEYHIVKSVEYGILTGYPDGTFRPEQTLTRAEAVIAIHRLTEQQNQQTDGDTEDQQTEEEAQNTLETMPQRPLTTVERFQTGNEPGFGNWLDTSQSKLPITDVLDDKDQFRALYKVKYYEIVYDFPYEFKIETDLLGGEMVNLGNRDGARAGILIKNRNPILLGSVGDCYYVANVPYDSKFPTDFEYIGFYNSGDEVMMLVPNPFQP